MTISDGYREKRRPEKRACWELQELFSLRCIFSFLGKVFGADAPSRFKVLLTKPLHVLFGKTVFPERNKSRFDLA
jgi:hypothetical protein